MSKYPGRIVTDLAPAGYSVYFDGSGDFLNSSHPALNATFTIEAWVYRTSGSANQSIVFLNSGGVSGVVVYIDGSNFLVCTDGVNAQAAFSNLTVPINAWAHVAVVRNGGTTTGYVNGIVAGSHSFTPAAVNAATIARYAAASPLFFPGYISNVRVVNGTAVYTAAFTPPTQLFNITNTSLLTCNSPAIIDQSNNAFAITVNGDSRVTTLTPFTAYVPYNPALGASTPGVWALDEALQARATRQWNMYDPSFNLTTLLLHGNGTNGAQNNTFLDSSSNNFTITRNGGNPGMTQGSFSPFSQTGWGNYFDGADSSLSLGGQTAFSFGTGDWTVEFWMYFTATGGTLFDTRPSGTASTNGYSVLFLSSSSVRYDTASGVKITGSTLSANTWYHVALCKASGTTRLFINGVQDGSSYTDSVNYGVGANRPIIGADGNVPTTVEFTGYLSNYRILKGTGLYTTTFTPPTSPLTNITNTSLLTCQSNRFVDNSTANSGSGFAITSNGTPSVQAFSPFYPTAAYTPATVGGSGYFDGTGDYLTAAQNAAFSLGTGAFAVEAFFYLTSFSLSNRIIGLGDGAYGIAPLTYSGWSLLVSSTQVQWYRYDGTETAYIATTTVNLNSWNHVVVCRDGSSNLAIFLNGNRILNQANVTTSYNNVNTNPLYLGRVDDGAGGGSITTKYITGYVSNARVVKGSSVYNPTQTTLTVPTSPLTNITNTSLLLNFTNAGIVDSTAKNVLETVGNAQISTTQSKFGGSSMYFDGTGDYLVTPSSPVNILGSGDFTVELWAYPSNISAGYRALVASENYNGTTGGWSIYQNGTAIEVWLTGSGSPLINATSSLTATTWQHIALSRASGTVRLFVNGISVGSASSSAEWTGQRIFIGDNNVSGTDYFFNGYIDDLRITKGFARYTGNFTPQTSQWQDE